MYRRTLEVSVSYAVSVLPCSLGSLTLMLNQLLSVHARLCVCSTSLSHGRAFAITAGEVIETEFDGLSMKICLLR